MGARGGCFALVILPSADGVVLVIGSKSMKGLLRQEFMPSLREKRSEFIPGQRCTVIRSSGLSGAGRTTWRRHEALDRSNCTSWEPRGCSFVGRIANGGRKAKLPELEDQIREALVIRRRAIFMNPVWAFQARVGELQMILENIIKSGMEPECLRRLIIQLVLHREKDMFRVGVLTGKPTADDDVER